jgi:hypothetical protein
MVGYRKLKPEAPENFSGKFPKLILKRLVGTC